MPKEILAVWPAAGGNVIGTSRTTFAPGSVRVNTAESFWYIGRALRVFLLGSISIPHVTPGTFRVDITMGAAGTTIVFDTLALQMNTQQPIAGVAPNPAVVRYAPWMLDVTLVCRAVGSGTATTFFPMGFWQSTAVPRINDPAFGGNGRQNIPVGTPAVGAGASNVGVTQLDIFYTQTVAADAKVESGLVQLLN